MGWYSNASGVPSSPTRTTYFWPPRMVRGSTSLVSAAITFGAGAAEPLARHHLAQRVGGGELLLDAGLGASAPRRRLRAAARTGSGSPRRGAWGAPRSATGSGGGRERDANHGRGRRRRAGTAAGCALAAAARRRRGRPGRGLGARRRRDQLARLAHVGRQRLLPRRLERLRRRLQVQDLARRGAAVEEEDVDVDADQPDQHDAQPQRPPQLTSAASTSLSCQYRPGGMQRPHAGPVTPRSTRSGWDQFTHRSSWRRITPRRGADCTRGPIPDARGPRVFRDRRSGPALPAGIWPMSGMVPVGVTNASHVICRPRISMRMPPTLGIWRLVPSASVTVRISSKWQSERDERRLPGSPSSTAPVSTIASTVVLRTASAGIETAAWQARGP